MFGYFWENVYFSDRQTLRTTDDMDHGRYGPLRRPAEKWDRTPATFTEVPTRAPPPSHRGAWLAVTDTYDGYERCSLTDLMDMYTCMSDNS